VSVTHMPTHGNSLGNSTALLSGDRRRLAKCTGKGKRRGQLLAGQRRQRWRMYSRTPSAPGRQSPKPTPLLHTNAMLQERDPAVVGTACGWAGDPRGTYGEGFPLSGTGVFPLTGT
jgi:hypothetical protein